MRLIVLLLCLMLCGFTVPPKVNSPERIAEYLQEVFPGVGYEINGQMHIQTPEETIKNGGNCLDIAILNRELLRRIRLDGTIVVIKFKGITLMHAVTMFNADGTISMLDGVRLIRTKTNSLKRAMSIRFPDWEQIRFIERIEGDKIIYGRTYYAI